MQRTEHSVLLIDDEHDLLEELGDYLRHHGMRVTAACNGEQGLTSLELADPDVIVCDVSMPGMNGHDVLKAIRARGDRFANVPFLFLTAHAALEDELLASGIGADDFIAKPENLARIAAKIQARINQASRFKQQAESDLEAARQRMLDAASRREQKFISTISQLSGTINQLGRHVSAIQSIVESTGDPDLAAATSQAITFAEKAARIARSASIIAGMPLAPFDLNRQLIDPAEVMKQAANAMMPSLKGSVTFEASGVGPIFADPCRLAAMTANILVWASAHFPGISIKANALQQADGRQIYDFELSSPYHSPAEVKCAWDKLLTGGMSLHDQGDTNFDPADSCALEIVDAIRIRDGEVTAAHNGDHAQIHIEIAKGQAAE